MSFGKLSKVLKNVVCEFAFGCNWEKTHSSLRMCQEIQSYGISPVFLRLQMWSWHYCQFKPSPLRVFEPIHRFTGRWSDIVDWHSVNELLFRLDYRRSVVKMGGTRHEWFEKFRRNWLSVRQFDIFYRIVLQTQITCFKPTYEVQRVTELSSWNSPFTSARWLLEEGGYATWGYH